MLKNFFLLGAVVFAGLLATGCAGPEKKLGRGINNLGEALRWGEMRRSMEQQGITGGLAGAHGRGIVSGFNRSLTRICVGAVEIATFPLPSYDPMLTNYLTPAPAYPDNYTPSLPDDSLYATDTTIGFSGGDFAPIIPGNRFSVFRTP
jgi:putative exosortase-associated protein (TIGR04073 family)